MMAEYGDLILKIFHKNNYTYSSQMTLDSLIQMVSKDSDQESRQILQKVRTRNNKPRFFATRRPGLIRF